MPHPRGGHRKRSAARGLKPQTELQLPARDPRLRRGLQRHELIVRRPQVLNLPRPRREDHTGYTAVAPDEVYTVRIYGTRPLYGLRLTSLNS